MHWKGDVQNIVFFRGPPKCVLRSPNGFRYSVDLAFPHVCRPDCYRQLVQRCSLTLPLKNKDCE